MPDNRFVGDESDLLIDGAPIKPSSEDLILQVLREEYGLPENPTEEEVRGAVSAAVRVGDLTDKQVRALEEDGVI